MYKQLIFCFFLLAFSLVKAQELNCNVTVNADQIQVSNNQIFKTLENSLTEFMNQTQWTNVAFKDHEKIKCAVTILLTEQKSTNTFVGTIQVQASRPVYNSSYYSPLLNYKDNSFSFQYTEFQPINYNPNGFESNLVSTLSYYAYLILGMYVDTFSLQGGTPYLNTALAIANQAQQSGYLGWENSKGNITRFTLVDNMLASASELYRKLMFQYHYDVMDVFERNQKAAASKMIQQLQLLEKMYDENPNSFMIRIFMDAKADEIVNIFQNNSAVDTSELVSILKRVSSTNSKKWRQINSL
ncbi:type IX secretion system protein PorD [Wenyingzhuangia sp. IMCC45467]